MACPLLTTARECQAVAKHFGDRQNSPSTLSPREAHAIVNACLNAGNLLEQEARNRAARESQAQENQPCPTSEANSISETVPNSLPPAAN